MEKNTLPNIDYDILYLILNNILKMKITELLLMWNILKIINLKINFILKYYHVIFFVSHIYEQKIIIMC